MGDSVIAQKKIEKANIAKNPKKCDFYKIIILQKKCKIMQLAYPPPPQTHLMHAFRPTQRVPIKRIVPKTKCFIWRLSLYESTDWIPFIVQSTVSNQGGRINKSGINYNKLEWKKPEWNG